VFEPPVRRFALDAAILFSDILIAPYPLGQPLEYRDGEGPVLEPVMRVAQWEERTMASSPGSTSSRIEQAFPVLDAQHAPVTPALKLNFLSHCTFESRDSEFTR
jgi:uroporphyrinogen-III decarboxylase